MRWEQHRSRILQTAFRWRSLETRRHGDTETGSGTLRYFGFSIFQVFVRAWAVWELSQLFGNHSSNVQCWMSQDTTSNCYSIVSHWTFRFRSAVWPRQSHKHLHVVKNSIRNRKLIWMLSACIRCAGLGSATTNISFLRAPRLRSGHVNVATEENLVNNSNEEHTSPAPTPQSEHKFMLL